MLLKKMFKRLLIILLSICIYFNSALADKLNEIIVKGNERISNETIILFSGIKLNDDIDTNILNDMIKNYTIPHFLKTYQLILRYSVDIVCLFYSFNELKFHPNKSSLLVLVFFSDDFDLP